MRLLREVLCVNRAKVVPTRSLPIVHCRKYSANGRTSSITPPSTEALKYLAVAGAIGVLGVWWLSKPSPDSHDPVPCSVPCFDGTPTEELLVEPGPSKDEVTRILSQGARSYPVKSVVGVNRYDVAQLASNSPCEDRSTHGTFPSPRGDGKHWMAWAVFDGHAGWQTADLLQKNLLPFVRSSLNQIGQYNTQDGRRERLLPEKMVQDAIMKAFTKLDDAIIKTALETSQSSESLQDKIKKFLPAFAGSCALLTLYDPAQGLLHAACTGDSRAVLGRKLPDGTWQAIPLSIDQTGSNEVEIARLEREHPGESSIVKDGRVLGMMVSRAFGDGRWKWPLEFQQSLTRKFYGPSVLTPKYEVQTPPYLTAEPVVTTTKIDLSTPCFLIMATDGLWNMLSNQQAVDLVGKRLDATQPSTKPVSSRTPDAIAEPFDFGHFWKGVSWKFVDARTTVQDDNIAVHLIRNSLGGNFHELVAGRLAFDPPLSRRLRDDMIVQVVLFNIPSVPRL